MALKGSFNIFGITLPNVYVKLSQISGNAGSGWMAYVEHFPDADAYTGYKTAKANFAATLVDAATAAAASLASPDDQPLQAAHDTAVQNELTAQATLNALTAPAPLPQTVFISAPYDVNTDPYPQLYAVLKGTAGYGALTDA